MNIEKKKVVAIVLEVDGAEYFKATRINEHGHYFAEIDGLAVICTIMPSNKYPGYFQILDELMALKLNEEVRGLLTNPDMSATDLLSLIERFQEQI